MPSKPIPERAREILVESPAVHLSTLMPGGEPKSEPVWVDVSGGLILVATDAATIKARNVEADGRVALSATAVADPYEQVLVRGRVSEIRSDDEMALLDLLAVRHLGAPFPRRRWGDRIVISIEPGLVRHYKSPLSELARERADDD